MKQSRKPKQQTLLPVLLAIVTVFVLLIVLLLAGYFYLNVQPSPDYSITRVESIPMVHVETESEHPLIPAETETESESESESSSESETEFEEETELISGLDPLEAELKSAISTYSGTWSVYVKPLSDEKNTDTLVINNTEMPSASVMKLFIMGAVYEAIARGEYAEDELTGLLDDMVTISDNASANELLSVLGNGSYKKGIDRVNLFIANHEYTDGTKEYNGFDSDEAFFGGQNIVTAKDCGHFLEDLYRGELINEVFSDKMLSLLSRQETNYKIPAFLPPEAIILNKTGELSDVQNDVAIILSPGGDYILCILSCGFEDEGNAITWIQDLSVMVYEYFNPKSAVKIESSKLSSR